MPFPRIDQEPFVCNREWKHLLRKLRSLHLGDIEISLQLVTFSNRGNLDNPIHHCPDKCFMTVRQQSPVHKQEKDSAGFCGCEDAVYRIAKIHQGGVKKIKREMIDNNKAACILEGEQIQKSIGGIHPHFLYVEPSVWKYFHLFHLIPDIFG